MTEIQGYKEMLDKVSMFKDRSPTNTLAHIFKQDNGENFISDWLAFLLDPVCVGTIEPLQLLLNIAGINNVSLSKFDDIVIEREHDFKDGGRIDFLITVNNDTIIAIENKIWSGFQPNQLERYRKALETIKKNDNNEILQYYGICIFPEKNEISKNLNEILNNGFMPVSYEKLVNGFKSVHLNCIDNMRAAVLLQDFITHMEEYILVSGNYNLDIERLEFLNEYKDSLDKLNQKRNADKQNFAGFIKQQMKNQIAEKDRSEWKTNKSDNYYYQLMKIGWEKHLVHFEILYNGSFPPQELKLELHTQEMHKEDTPLYKLNKEFGVFRIDYTSELNFENSINKIMDALGVRIAEFTDKIDEALKYCKKDP